MRARNSYITFQRHKINLLLRFSRSKLRFKLKQICKHPKSIPRLSKAMLYVDCRDKLQFVASHSFIHSVNSSSLTFKYFVSSRRRFLFKKKVVPASYHPPEKRQVYLPSICLLLLLVTLVEGRNETKELAYPLMLSCGCGAFKLNTHIRFTERDFSDLTIDSNIIYSVYESNKKFISPHLLI